MGTVCSIGNRGIGGSAGSVGWQVGLNTVCSLSRIGSTGSLGSGVRVCSFRYVSRLAAN